MADSDFALPSFSLGLDFDLDSQPWQSNGAGPNVHSTGFRPTSTSSRAIEGEEDCGGDFETSMMVPESPVSGTSRTLKRLRRGPTPKPVFKTPKTEPQDARSNPDDDIEDFSSEGEDRLRADGPAMHSVCSSSKIQLHGHGVLSSQPASKRNVTKKQDGSNASACSNVETSGSKLVFPKLTVSPLRRFQLIDSDSDSEGPSVSKEVSREADKLDSSSRNKQSEKGQNETPCRIGTLGSSVSKYKSEDLWKDFCPEKGINIPTPAFDEVCEEYFRSVKDKSEVQNNCKNSRQKSVKSSGQQKDVASFSPAHRYFFHEDPRIQKLVRDRLPNFFPLGVVNNQGCEQHGTSVIDYMGQFSHGENSKQAAQKRSGETSSSSTRRNAKRSRINENSPASENWVNPKSCSALPKDAGKRRVHAVEKSAGHWSTSTDGTRVYVNKNGQELTGQIAYRHYRKESGMGFKNKKKAAAKKKAATKKKNAGKKKNNR